MHLLSLVFGLLVTFVATTSLAMAQESIQSTTVEDTFALPASEEGLPGEGELRRFDWYVQSWRRMRRAWSDQAQQDQHAVVFFGDSITQSWGDDFQGKFAGMKLANRGISGDTTRGMLIRLQQDVLSLNPSAIVMLMGTNDIEVGIDPDAIGRNFAKIIQAVKAHDKNTPIILCRVFPSSSSKDRPRETIEKVNQLYESAVKGDPQVTVLDTWTMFASDSGDADPRWFRDLLHLNAAGYEKWALALHPLFATLGFVETTPDSFEPEPGFVNLFNGNDLTGWGFRVTPARKKRRNPHAPAFSTVSEPVSFDGQSKSNDDRYRAIHGRLVVTTPPEGRRVQQLWTTQEFSGDFVLKLEFRATPNADSGVFIRVPQLQCRDYSLAGPYKDLKNYRPQDWNELVVTVTDAVATATCNGELLTDDMQVPPTGPIGLEGDRGQMEYRRIRLKKVSP